MVPVNSEDRYLRAELSCHFRVAHSLEFDPIHWSFGFAGWFFRWPFLRYLQIVDLAMYAAKLLNKIGRVQVLVRRRVPHHEISLLFRSILILNDESHVGGDVDLCLFWSA